MLSMFGLMHNPIQHAVFGLLQHPACMSTLLHVKPQPMTPSALAVVCRRNAVTRLLCNYLPMLEVRTAAFNGFRMTHHPGASGWQGLRNQRLAADFWFSVCNFFIYLGPHA